MFILGATLHNMECQPYLSNPLPLLSHVRTSSIAEQQCAQAVEVDQKKNIAKVFML